MKFKIVIYDVKVNANLIVNLETYRNVGPVQEGAHQIIVLGKRAPRDESIIRRRMGDQEQTVLERDARSLPLDLVFEPESVAGVRHQQRQQDAEYPTHTGE